MKSTKPILLTVLLLVAIGFGIYFLYHRQVPSVLWWITGSTVGALIAWIEYFSPCFEDRRKQFNIDSKQALTQLSNEKGNFGKIIDAQKSGKVFSGSEKDSVEVTAFRKSLEEFERLSKYWGFKRLSKKGIREVNLNKDLPLEKKDVHKLLDIVNQIIEKLQSKTSLF
ncbi:MAG: hypothetical protein CME32_09200 [Gimesia sp.]|nr:hypothetical protein [Gimesia sp.]